MQKDNILTTYFWVYIYYIVFLTLNNPLMITLLTLITLSFGTNHESKALIEYTQKTGNAVYGTNNTFLKWPFFPPTNSKITNLNAPAKTSNENNPNLNINPLHDMLWEKIKNEKNRARLREREVRDRRM